MLTDSTGEGITHFVPGSSVLGAVTQGAGNLGCRSCLPEGTQPSTPASKKVL